MAASNLQVQQFVDGRFRPTSEKIQAFVAILDSLLAANGDVYAALTATNPAPTWTDGRADGPPHLLTPLDVVRLSDLMTDVRNYIKAHANYTVVGTACVQPINI